MTDLDASVVIGFKDWGTDRLARCVSSIHASLSGHPHEVIVSDYGSENAEAVRAAAEAAGATVIRTETDGTWSSGRAQNAGFAHATGRVFMNTDADMIFTPHALARVVERLSEAPSEAIILQSRDLPYSVTEQDLLDPDWQDLATVATVRPRWGCGGLVATHRDTYLKLRGYDERMHTYGGEDIDYLKRLRRSGATIHWLDEPSVRMYHVWHPSTSAAAAQDPAATAAIKRNRELHTNDNTTVRNVVRWTHRHPEAPPVVSVMVNCEEYTDPSDGAVEISTLLGQTLTDIEIVLVGGDSSWQRFFNDPRVAVAPRLDDGWVAAIKHSRGTFITLHARRQLHVSNRLERLVNLTSTSGRAIADSTAMVTRSSSGVFSPVAASILNTFPNPWSSVLIPRQNALDGLSGAQSGSPEDLLYAILRGGVFITAEEALGSVFTAPAEIELQQDLAKSADSRRRLEWGGSDKSWLDNFQIAGHLEPATKLAAETYDEQYDFILVTPSGHDLAVEATSKLSSGLMRSTLVTDGEGTELFSIVRHSGLSFADVSLMRSTRESTVLGEATARSRTSMATVDDSTEIDVVMDECSRIYTSDPTAATWIVVSFANDSGIAGVFHGLERMSGLTCVLRRDVIDEFSHHRLVMAALENKSDGISALNRVRAIAPAGASVELRCRPAVISLSQLTKVDAR